MLEFLKSMNFKNYLLGTPPKEKQKSDTMSPSSNIPYQKETKILLSQSGKKNIPKGTSKAAIKKYQNLNKDCLEILIRLCQEKSVYQRYLRRIRLNRDKFIYSKDEGSLLLI